MARKRIEQDEPQDTEGNALKYSDAEIKLDVTSRSETEAETEDTAGNAVKRV